MLSTFQVENPNTAWKKEVVDGKVHELHRRLEVLFGTKLIDPGFIDVPRAKPARVEPTNADPNCALMNTLAQTVYARKNGVKDMFQVPWLASRQSKRKPERGR